MNQDLSKQPDNQPIIDPTDSRMISGRSVFGVLIITLLAFITVSVFFFTLAMQVVIEELYDDTTTVDQIVDDQERLLQEMLYLVKEGVSGWPPKMKIAWMFNQAVIFLPVLIFLRLRKLPVYAHLRLRPVPTKFYGYSVMIGLSFAFIGDELTRLVDMIRPIPEYIETNLMEMLRFESSMDFMVVFLTICVIAPLVEEALFRGFLQRWFEQHRGVTSGVLATSALFAVVHANLYFLIPILLLAVIMGAMAWRVESIMPTIVVHAVNNGLGLLGANYYGREDPSWYVMGNHVAPWWMLLAMGVLYFSLQNYFKLAEELKIGGHGPRGSSGSNLNISA